jgi:hypothetical protein
MVAAKPPYSAPESSPGGGRLCEKHGTKAQGAHWLKGRCKIGLQGKPGPALSTSLTSAVAEKVDAYGEKASACTVKILVVAASVTWPMRSHRAIQDNSASDAMQGANPCPPKLITVCRPGMVGILLKKLQGWVYWFSKHDHLARKHLQPGLQLN